MKFRIGAATVLLGSAFTQAALAQQAQGAGDSSMTYGTANGVGTTTNVAAQPAPGTMQQPAMAAAPADPAPGPAQPALASQPETAPAPGGEAPANSDHQAMVGRLAVGYLGYVNIPFGALSSIDINEPPAGSNQYASAPVIGVRLWLNQTLGIDAGLGVTTTFGTKKVEAVGVSNSINATAPTGLAVHFGIPLALKAAKHYAFLLIPETNIGYAQQAIPNQAATLGTDHSGLHLDIGARAGAELHFGFIGVPELSLVGSVGLRVDVTQTKTEDKATNVTTKDSRTIIHTTVGSDPWDIFAGNISAFYYL